MHNSVFFDFGLRLVEDASLPAISSACLYGNGIFTTLAIYDGKPFLWDKHWYRLEKNSALLNIDLGLFNENTVRKSIDELIAANGKQNGRARITFFDSSAASLWSDDAEKRTSLLITTADFRPKKENVSLTLSPFRVNSTSPIAGIKSCNYLEKTLALDEAKARGFDEAIQLNERGNVVSACMANIFWSKDAKLFTPSLKTGCLAGTTREFVLENFSCEEVEVGVEHLRSADEIFLTSAGIGVVQIAKIEERILRLGQHPILELIPLDR